MEFSHWRQKIYAGQKILLGCKIQASELYDMVHTENFVLVDTKKRVRGYDGTKEDIKRLIEDITFLSTN
jgi:protein SCO1/2